MENNKEKVYEDDKHFADSNNGKKIIIKIIM